MDSSGAQHHVKLTVAMIPRSQQSIAFLLDITDIKRAEGKLHELAYTDALTGLPNRLSALDRLTRTLTRLDPESSSLAVYLLDLDDFKIINDSWGHAAGDIVLMEVGQRLLSVLDSSEMLARLGGDEFIVVSGIGADDSEYSGLAQKLIDTFSSPFELEGSETFLGVSVGVAVFPKDGDTAGQLVRCADLAMYQSKSLGKNMFHFHSPELTQNAQRRVEIERELRLALDAGEIEAFFQPVIDLDTQKSSEPKPWRGGANRTALSSLRWISYPWRNRQTSSPTSISASSPRPAIRPKAGMKTDGAGCASPATSPRGISNAATCQGKCSGSSKPASCPRNS